MNQHFFGQGHVRLLAALVAAASLHALLLMRGDDSTLTITTRSAGDPLQVALLPQAERHHRSDHPESKSVTEMGAKTEARQSSIVSPEPILRQEKAPLSDSVLREAEAKAHESENNISSRSEKIVMAQVPAAVQSTILAKVDYPWRARRRGFEGIAEFRFDVSRQAIQQVSMLTSSGYPVLDRAARRGILSAGSLPLDDGSYRLPVIFQLK